MGLFSKLKLLFLIQKPAGEVFDAVAEAKKTKKYWHLAATLLGMVVGSSALWASFLPPQYAIVITAAAVAAYTIARGADKADNEDVKGYFTSSEFYVQVAGALQACFIAMKAGGISPAWIDGALSMIAIAAGSGQNLAARAPLDTDTAATTPDAVK